MKEKDIEDLEITYENSKCDRKNKSLIQNLNVSEE